MGHKAVALHRHRDRKAIGRQVVIPLVQTVDRETQAAGYLFQLGGAERHLRTGFDAAKRQGQHEYRLATCVTDAIHRLCSPFLGLSGRKACCL